ncbi:hypothetical protein [Staphylococcus argenteus]|uniref:hypothetical protein n=1 Tax=Staphylococcus argenteus TaxID=985002 RepID=UPI001FC84485|nr:hypothetical protein [Staphylococcus argenteus]GJF88672.1 hypothetical protein SA20092_18780 [Staphylococcus argenteus]
MKMRLEQAFFQYWGPNIEGDGKSAVINVKVGDGAQHREFQKEILQTMQVGETTIKQYFFFRN